MSWLSAIRMVSFVLLVSCASATDMQQRIPMGPWGGDHIAIEVGEKSAKVEYDCAHGVIEGPLEVDAKGRFNLRGTHTLERGGPIRADEQPRSEPARYAGAISGNKMTLTLKLEGADEETFTLEKGKEPNLFKCK